MDRSSPLPSDEAQPLNTRPSRLSAEAIELSNHPYGRSISPLSPPGSTTYYSEDSGGRGGAEPSYTPIDSQEPKQHGLHHHIRETPKQRDSSIQRLWLWEVLSIALAALALAAIVITLLLRRDRPLPKWPSAITINALIAVFTAIFKACLMMPIAESIGQLKWLWYQKSRPLRHMEEWDLASRGGLSRRLSSSNFLYDPYHFAMILESSPLTRLYPGPWGSLLLIFALKSRDIAVIGAVITIVAMAVDPFTQQIVQFYSCSTEIEGELATAPFSNNYTAGFVGRPTGTPDLDPQMLSAIYTGLLDPPVNVSTALAFECRTGNCTFPSTDDGATLLSLGLESRCVDISRDVSVSVNVTTYKDNFNETAVDRTVNASLADYNIYLSNESWWWPMKTGSNYSNGWPASSLLKIAFLMAPSSTDLQHTQAFECEFYPVVNTLSTNVTNGVLLEQVLDSQRMNVWSIPWGTHTLLMVNRTIKAGEWHQCNSSREQSDEHNFPVVNRPDPPGPSLGTSDTLDELASNNFTEWWPQDCVFWIDYAPTEGLASTLDGFLGNESLYLDSWTQRPKGDLWSVNLWNNGSATLETVQAATDGLSRSITARWRQGDGISDNMGPVVGTVLGNQTCVRVNWAWIALPASLLLLAVVFLVLTIVRTRSKQAQVWKGSIFAVLFSGFDQEMRQAAGPVFTMEDMKAAASRATVRLEDTKEGFRLVSQT